MPFPTSLIGGSGAVSAELFSAYFGDSGSINFSEYYLGNRIPNVSLNSSHPSSGALSFLNMVGKYGTRTFSTSITAGSVAGRVGYSLPVWSIGSIGSDTYSSSLGNSIRLVEAYQYSGSLIISLGNTAGTPSVSSWTSDDDRNIWRITIGSAIITMPTATGSGGGAGTEFYLYSIPYANTLFSNGSSYSISIDWVE